MDIKHMAEPWFLNTHGGDSPLPHSIVTDSGYRIAKMNVTTDPPELTTANGRRIVACVNACAGMNPQAIPGLLAACESVCERHETWEGKLTDSEVYGYKILKRAITKTTEAP